jgi:hypothetical protein
LAQAHECGAGLRADQQQQGELGEMALHVLLLAMVGVGNSASLADSPTGPGAGPL